MYMSAVYFSFEELQFKKYIHSGPQNKCASLKELRAHHPV